jgi:hypothetical protein
MEITETGKRRKNNARKGSGKDVKIYLLLIKKRLG